MRRLAGLNLLINWLLIFSFISSKVVCASVYSTSSPSADCHDYNEHCNVKTFCRMIKLRNGTEIPTALKKIALGGRNVFACKIAACVSEPCMNGATCTDILDGYSCQCSGEFTGNQCEHALTKVLLSHDRTIYKTAFATTDNYEERVNLLNLSYHVVYTAAASRINAVEYDPKQDQVYFAFETRIDRIQWDGSGEQTFFNGSNNLALDVNGRIIYWIVESSYSISMSPMDINQLPVEGEFLYDTGISNPFTVFFDRFQGNLYWGESSHISRRIGNMEESIVEENIKWAKGLFVDTKDDRMYWSQNTNRKNIESVRLNGKDRKMYFPNSTGNSSSNKFRRFVVFDGVMYWSAENTPGIGRVDVTGDDLKYYQRVLELRVERDDAHNDSDDDNDDDMDGVDAPYGTVQLGANIDFFINGDFKNDRIHY
ncbi:prolow-density lipoprotein receptor-related protein 1-like [Lytechinus pictus]|uniref:prolow-density lipoprotein receptor-related protein 1-like n=1 Tax=Lytechinus pictus TaxID=7653 RepID=UPI0030B9BD89